MIKKCCRFFTMCSKEILPTLNKPWGEREGGRERREVDQQGTSLAFAPACTNTTTLISFRCPLKLN
jgi:hypothetical protein